MGLEGRAHRKLHTPRWPNIRASYICTFRYILLPDIKNSSYRQELRGERTSSCSNKTLPNIIIFVSLYLTKRKSLSLSLSLSRLLGTYHTETFSDVRFFSIPDLLSYLPRYLNFLPKEAGLT